jgi:hypothetical protein
MELHMQLNRQAFIAALFTTSMGAAIGCGGSKQPAASPSAANQENATPPQAEAATPPTESASAAKPEQAVVDPRVQQPGPTYE